MKENCTDESSGVHGRFSRLTLVKRYAHLAPKKLQENAEIVADVLEPSVTILSQCEKLG